MRAAAYMLRTHALAGEIDYQLVSSILSKVVLYYLTSDTGYSSLFGLSRQLFVCSRYELPELLGCRVRTTTVAEDFWVLIYSRADRIFASLHAYTQAHATERARGVSVTRGGCFVRRRRWSGGSQRQMDERWE